MKKILQNCIASANLASFRLVKEKRKRFVKSMRNGRVVAVAAFYQQDLFQSERGKQIGERRHIYIILSEQDRLLAKRTFILSTFIIRSYVPVYSNSIYYTGARKGMTRHEKQDGLLSSGRPVFLVFRWP